MSTMKKGTALLIATALVFSFGIAGALATQNVTLADIREEAKDGWHQTYEAHGRTITVDLDILVPLADTVPVLKLELAPQPDDAALAAYDTVELYPLGSSVISVVKGDPGNGNIYKKVSGNITDGPTQWMDAPQIDWSVHAEDNPMTMQEATDLTMGVIEQLYGPQISGQYEVKNVGAGGKIYRWKGYDGNTAHLTTPLDQPGNIGTYYISLRPVFHDIPVIYGGGGWFSDYTRVELPSEQPLGYEAGAFVTTAQDYSVSIHAVREAEQLHADIPLAPFADVKQALETQIANGRVRTLERLEFGYVQYYDPERVDACWLVPCWVAFGEMYDDAKGEPKLYKDPEMEFTQKENGWLVVQAQTGQLQDTFDPSRTRRYVPETFGWN